jgi:hypothetical protein
MHTESNPQQPASTATTADLPKPTTTAEPKPTTAKKPEAKTPRPQRGTTKSTGSKPAAKDGQAAKASDNVPNKASALTAATSGPREGSTMWAVLQVLGKATEPLSAKDIYAEITKRKLAPGLKGKTPDQTIAAKLAISAKNGEYVERAAPGKFQLLKERS